MATHSSVLAWRIPGTGEPGGLPSIGLHRVGHDWSDLAAEAAAGLQHTRPPCPSPPPGVYSHSCPLSWWDHPTISSSVVPFLLPPSIFPSIRVFSNESAVRIRWPKYWSFSFDISPSNEYSGLISFSMDWLDLLVVRGTLKSLLQPTGQKHQFFSLQLSS